MNPNKRDIKTTNGTITCVVEDANHGVTSDYRPVRFGANPNCPKCSGYGMYMFDASLGVYDHCPKCFPNECFDA